MESEFEKCLVDTSFKELEPDAYQGKRYTIRGVKDGIEIPVRLPPVFVKMSKVHLAEMYTYLYQEDDDDEDFVLLTRCIKSLEDKIKTRLNLPNLAPVIKEDRKGFVVKLYGSAGKANSKFVDKDGVLIEPDDERLTSAGYTRIVYPIINVDSVYVTSAGNASIQMKLSECACFFTKVQTSLDLDMINRLRAMKIGRKK